METITLFGYAVTLEKDIAIAEFRYVLYKATVNGYTGYGKKPDNAISEAFNLMVRGNRYWSTTTT